MPAIRHHTIVVDGLQVFIREAGDPALVTANLHAETGKVFLA